MKARVKATGEIVEVTECGQTFKDMRMDYMDMKGRCYESEDLDFSDNTPFDYWIRLEHQYAGMALQGLIAHTNIDYDEIVDLCVEFAHALVEKMKEGKV